SLPTPAATGLADPKRPPPPLHLPVNPVTGDPRRVLNNGDALADKAIEQSGFADIRPADDGDKRLSHADPPTTIMVPRVHYGSNRGRVPVNHRRPRRPSGVRDPAQRDIRQEALDVRAADASRVPDGGIGGATGNAPLERLRRRQAAPDRGEDPGNERVAAAQGVDRLNGRRQRLPLLPDPGGQQGPGARGEQDDGHTGSGDRAHRLPGRIGIIERPAPERRQLLPVRLDQPGPGRETDAETGAVTVQGHAAPERAAGLYHPGQQRLGGRAGQTAGDRDQLAAFDRRPVSLAQALTVRRAPFRPGLGGG